MENKASHCTLVHATVIILSIHSIHTLTHNVTSVYMTDKMLMQLTPPRSDKHIIHKDKGSRHLRSTCDLPSRLHGSITVPSLLFGLNP